MSKGTQASHARRMYLKVQPNWSYAELLYRSISRQVFPYQRPFLDAIRAGEQIVPLRGSPTGRFLPRMDTLDYQLLPTSPKPKPTPSHKFTEVNYSELEIRALAHYSKEDLEISAEVEALLKAKHKEIDEALWLAAMYGSRPGPLVIRKEDAFVVGKEVKPSIKGLRGWFIIEDDIS